MNIEEFRKNGKEMVDYICEYLSTLPSRRVIPDVQPGYLRPLMPPEAPEQSEDWSQIMEDIERLIMPGITHWQHPRFHAYFPAGNSFPSIMGDMLSDAIGCVGFSWAASPACAELEMVVLDWLARMMSMPKEFTHEFGRGGGVLQSSASDCVLVTMLAARHSAVEEYKRSNPDVNPGIILSKLVGYCSSEAHSCVEKAGVISFVKIRQLGVDEKYSLRGLKLSLAIEEDRKNGLIPFYVCATLGTTGCCSFDNLAEISTVCKDSGVWLHVDAAYAGSAFICQEFQHYLEGIENVMSFSFNPNKWMMVNFDASVLWVRESKLLTSSMVVNPVYLQHKHSSKAVDFRHWGIPLSRRFRALKLWFVIRSYGVEGLQNYIREHTRLAKIFEDLVRGDSRFEVVGAAVMGLACFRLKGLNSMTQCLIRSINESGKLHMVPAVVNDLYIIRFAVCAERASHEDILHAWEIVRTSAEEIITTQNSFEVWRRRVHGGSGQPGHYRSMAGTKSISEEEIVPNTPEKNRNQLLEGPFNDVGGVSVGGGGEAAVCNLHPPEKEEVFICENDLGVGVPKDSIITSLRRNTLLRMISDPGAYNRKVIQSLCFCSGCQSSTSERASISESEDCDY